MSIGLEFVKKVDKNWKDHIKKIDTFQEMDDTIEKIDNYYEHEDILKKDDAKLNSDKTGSFWEYWKNKYNII